MQRYEVVEAGVRNEPAQVAWIAEGRGGWCRFRRPGGAAARRAARPGSWLLVLAIGCVGAMGGCAAVSPEDDSPALVSDFRIEGNWALEVDSGAGDWLLGDSFCVRIEEFTTASWMLACEEDVLLGGFPAVRGDGGTIRVDSVLLVDGLQRRVRLELEPQSEDLITGTISLLLFDADPTELAPVTLTRL